MHSAQDPGPRTEETPDRGRRLMGFLSLPLNGRVLLHGEALPGWDGESWCVDRLREIRHDTRYSLIVLETQAASSRRHLRDLVTEAEGALEPEGLLFLLCRNSFSPHRGRERPKSASADRDDERSTTPLLSPGWAAQILHRCGFRTVSHFLCFPNLRSPKEFAAPTSPFLEFPDRSNWVHKLARWSGLLPRLHPSHLLLAGKRRRFDAPLARRVRRAARLGVPGTDTTEIQISRFDIRRRGSLAMFLTNESDGARLIGRLTTGSGRANRVARNHEFLNSLRGHAELSPLCRQRMPVPLSSVVECGDARVHLETLLPGVLAWKADWSRHGSAIQRDAVQFIDDFGRSLQRPVSLDDVALGRLFDRDRKLIDRSAFLASEDRERLNTLLAWTAQALRGHTLPVVYGHGDFGVGNVLVHHETGRLTGVIDWETGREWELPGVDRLNWELQRSRMQGAAGLGCAIREVAKGLLSDRGHGVSMLQPLIGSPGMKLRAAILVTCGIRYVCRDIQYPEIYRKLQPEFSEGLSASEWVTRELVR